MLIKSSLTVTQYCSTRALVASTLAAGLLLFAGCEREPVKPPVPSPQSEQNPGQTPGQPSPSDATPPPQQPVPPAPSPTLPSWAVAPDVKVPQPPREFRAAWVATVANIDWPSKPGLSSDEQRAEMRRIIEIARVTNLNALVLQVRPTCDAIYISELEPWSEFLTGASGKPPEPLYDPLATWIDECHAAGIELHAWFNPFRARHFEAKGPDAPNHVTNTMKDVVYQYDRFSWMDPGSPLAQDWALRVIRDVVTRYDIDGVHIDDYFYPYPKEKVPFPDSATYAQYKQSGGELTLENWRRWSIDTFVDRMYSEVKSVKPHVKVGISPFGIWRPGNPAGVAGFDAYANLYADARKWLNDGDLDYCSPQLYWAISAPKQPFAGLLDWWRGENTQQRYIIPGIYTSRLDPNTKQWEPNEIIDQVTLVRSRSDVPGVVHFSMKALTLNYKSIATQLTSGVYSAPALPPAYPWLKAPEPTLTSLRTELNQDELTILWGGATVSATPSAQSQATPQSPADAACRTVAVAWRRMGTTQDWVWEFLAVQAGGATRTVRDTQGTPLYDAVAIAPVARNGELGAFTTFATNER
jgi:uncharacterized lipoprotein YddW (UPF0748 family)